PDTFNLDERLLEDAITRRTKAVVLIHYGGVACAMDVIGDIAARHGIAIVEDNAHGLGATSDGRPLGSFGALATQSFHETKNVQCGEGGALVVNDPALLERAEILREKGTNRTQFARGEVDKYRWLDVGSSYLPGDLLAALLCAQLDAFDDIQARRGAIWSTYDTELSAWRRDHGVPAQHVPADVAHPSHLYSLLLPDRADRDRFIRHMADAGITSPFHYVPLHDAPGARGRSRVAPSGCAVTNDVSARLARLPLFPDLGATGVERVLEAVVGFVPRRPHD
ncbi:MAG: dTDP-4-amino-4,6-dideoxygalactose transaminase, partial [Actinomycetales bacterium]